MKRTPHFILTACLIVLASPLLRAQDAPVVTPLPDKPAPTVETSPAPAVDPNPTPASAPSTPPAPADNSAPSSLPASSAPADNSAPSDPAPSDEFSQQNLPAEKPKKPIPTSSGDRTGPIWIGHRAVIDRYAGWGWIKKDKQSWGSAKWVMLEEAPGKSVAPGRHYGRPTGDDGMTYRLYGEFTDYKGYEPNYDVFVDVFRIRGWETIGKEQHPNLRPPRSSSGGPPRWSERGANLRR
ncbi:MAG: hypothetical protein SFU85_10465 [Candidatus Methylacidiphilales bacterium]|nr:hypothetical protein [Candidatus Methylacidiphilales bacterium]